MNQKYKLFKFLFIILLILLMINLIERRDIKILI